MKNQKTHLLLIAAAAVFAGACTVSKTEAPPLQGPSSLGLTLNIGANPDVLSFDGASQSQITIVALDANGQPAANVGLRAEIIANGNAVDFGSLSARTLVTNSQGRATLTYTSPTPVSGPIPTVEIQVTPSGSDASSASPRVVQIQLVPSGTITGSGPTPSFTFSPSTPAAFQDVVFTNTSKTSVGGIATTSWDFGDGSTATGATATHRFAQGNWPVTMTTTDTLNASSSTTQTVSVSAGTPPTADFVFSPTSPSKGSNTCGTTPTSVAVVFNGSISTASAGHRIVNWVWDFGTGGATASGSSVTKCYDTTGVYNVVLTVTDEVGQQKAATKSVTIAP